MGCLLIARMPTSAGAPQPRKHGRRSGRLMLWASAAAREFTASPINTVIAAHEEGIKGCVSRPATLPVLLTEKAVRWPRYYFLVGRMIPGLLRLTQSPAAHLGRGTRASGRRSKHFQGQPRLRQTSSIEVNLSLLSSPRLPSRIACPSQHSSLPPLHYLVQCWSLFSANLV
jgi:hypothetical protein